MTPMNRFYRFAIALAACASLWSCAASQDARPAVCDGRHRRPANPYGSVLPTLPGPGGGPSAPATSKTAPPPLSPSPPAPPAKLSAIDPRSGAPCKEAAG